MRLNFPNGDHGEVVIDRGTLSLGSAPGNDIVLESEGIDDSHARLSMEADGLHLRPVGEADVFVNGRRIHDRTRVVAGDVLGLHKVQIRLREAEPGGADASVNDAPVPDATRVRPAVAAWQLRGVSGDTFGRLVPLQGRQVVGRGENCDVVLEATEVSRRHAVLEVSAGGVVVEDMDSSNGTFVNGERVRKKQLNRGDEIAFDKVRFRLEMATGRSAAPRPSAPARPAAEPAAAGGRGWLAAGVVLVLLAAAAGAAWYTGWI